VNTQLTLWQQKSFEKLCPGVMIMPMFLSTDKVKLTMFSGDMFAYPVYVTITNISKGVRRKPSARATVLAGYLPVSKLECFSPEKRSLAGSCLFHQCMHSLLEPMAQAGKEGVEMQDPSGIPWLFFPILAAYITDYPEQCLIACCQESCCSRCIVPQDKRGEMVHSLWRDHNRTLEALNLHRNKAAPHHFKEHRIRPVYAPFWTDPPHCNIFSCITPDIMHELHKGVFFDHSQKWCTEVVSAAETDCHFQAQATFPGLCIFRTGILVVSQWTMSEHKEMEKVFLGLLVGATCWDCRHRRREPTIGGCRDASGSARQGRVTSIRLALARCGGGTHHVSYTRRCKLMYLHLQPDLVVLQVCILIRLALARHGGA
jgi:hypothetical protein